MRGLILCLVILSFVGRFFILYPSDHKDVGPVLHKLETLKPPLKLPKGKEIQAGLWYGQLVV